MRCVEWLSAVELVGYLASALVVTSLAMTSVVRLRAVSLVGSLTFVGYGLLIASIPIVLTNGAIAALNVHFLRRELGRRRDLDALPIAADAPFLVDFLRSHAADIRQSQPDFRLEGQALPADAFALLLTRDHLPAGAVVGHRVTEDGHSGRDGTAGATGSALHLDLDYVMEAYRDSRIGSWLYGDGASVFTRHGIRRLLAAPQTTTHRGYLTRVGFRQEGELWVRTLE